MNHPNDYLYDLELPNTGFSTMDTHSIWLIAIMVLFVLIIAVAIGYRHQRQQPLAYAKRQLSLLSINEPDPHALAAILRQGLQVQRLKDSTLPKDFLQRLEKARFSAQPCSTELFTHLKEEAQHLLTLHHHQRQQK